MLTPTRHSLHELFWGGRQRGTMTQHKHTSLTAYKNWSLIPSSFEQQNTLFVTSARAETSWLIFSFSCSVIQGCSFQFPHQWLLCTRKISTGASFGYRNWRGGEGESQCSCNCWAHRHSLSLYSTAQLWVLGNTWGLDSFRLTKRSSFLDWKADMNMYEGGKGLKGHF